VRFGNYEITRDGETAALNYIGISKKTGKETTRPVAYVRDLLGALEAMQRKMSVEAFDQQSDAKKLMKLLKEQHKDLLDTVKKNCNECLK